MGGLGGGIGIGRLLRYARLSDPRRPFSEWAPTSHVPPADPRRPYKCQLCQRIGLTALSKPECAGLADDPHPISPMKLVGKRKAKDAVKLVIR